MPEKNSTSEADLEKARRIVSEHGLLIGPAGKMSEVVAKAVAEGIALGRKEGIAMGAKSDTRRKGGSGT